MIAALQCSSIRLTHNFAEIVDELSKLPLTKNDKQRPKKLKVNRRS